MLFCEKFPHLAIFAESLGGDFPSPDTTGVAFEMSKRQDFLTKHFNFNLPLSIAPGRVAALLERPFNRSSHAQNVNID